MNGLTKSAIKNLLEKYFPKDIFIFQEHPTQSEDLGEIDGISWEKIDFKMIEKYEDGIFDNFNVFWFFYPAIIKYLIFEPRKKSRILEKFLSRLGSIFNEEEIVSPSKESNILEKEIFNWINKLDKNKLSVSISALENIREEYRTAGELYEIGPKIDKVIKILSVFTARKNQSID